MSSQPDLFEIQIYDDNEYRENMHHNFHLNQDGYLDPIDKFTEENDAIANEFVNDENAPLLTPLDQQYEELLMVSSISSSCLSTGSSPKQEWKNPFYDYFQHKNSSYSPVPSNLDLFYDHNSSESDYNSLDDHSSISNIIYTNKMKEKLRRQRHSSIDIPTCKVNKPTNAHSHSHSRSRSRTLVPSLSLKRSSMSRTKSVSSLSSQSLHSISLTSSPTSSMSSMSNSSSPTTKAVNPFYQPPAILKYITNQN